MPESAAPVYIFSAVTSTMWVATLAWSFSRKQRDLRWYNVFVLLAATLAWWLGESSAIRLGKYQYSPYFPAGLILPLGGTPNQSDWLRLGLNRLSDFFGIPAVGSSKLQESWNIPFPVVALEACLVFAFVRLSYFRLKNKGPFAAVAAACFSAVLMVTLAAILDPVVSSYTWCGAPGNDPDRHGLFKFEIWHWFTDENYAGYWFGVPSVNYIAWLIGMGSFTFLVRLNDDGPYGLVRRYDRWYEYVWAAAKFLFYLFLLQIPVKLVMDLVLVRFRELLPSGIRPDAQVWEFGWIALLMGACTFVVWLYGKVHPDPRREWVCNSPPVVVLVLCLFALVLEWRWGRWLNLIWVLSFVITGIVAGLPYIIDRLPEKRRAQVLGESREHGWRTVR